MTLVRQRPMTPSELPCRAGPSGAELGSAGPLRCVSGRAGEAGRGQGASGSGQRGAESSRAAREHSLAQRRGGDEEEMDRGERKEKDPSKTGKEHEEGAASEPRAGGRKLDNHAGGSGSVQDPQSKPPAPHSRSLPRPDTQLSSPNSAGRPGLQLVVADLVELVVVVMEA